MNSQFDNPNIISRVSLLKAAYKNAQADKSNSSSQIEWAMNLGYLLCCYLQTGNLKTVSQFLNLYNTFQYAYIIQ